VLIKYQLTINNVHANLLWANNIYSYKQLGPQIIHNMDFLSDMCHSILGLVGTFFDIKIEYGIVHRRVAFTPYTFNHNWNVELFYLGTYSGN
jgi:hypothetical protein